MRFTVARLNMFCPVGATTLLTIVWQKMRCTQTKLSSPEIAEFLDLFLFSIKYPATFVHGKQSDRSAFIAETERESCSKRIDIDLA